LRGLGPAEVAADRARVSGRLARLRHARAMTIGLAWREQRERSESKVTTVVWTDGSWNANGLGRGGWAALIEQAGPSVRAMAGRTA